MECLTASRLAARSAPDDCLVHMFANTLTYFEHTPPQRSRAPIGAATVRSCEKIIDGPPMNADKRRSASCFHRCSSAFIGGHCLYRVPRERSCDTLVNF